MSADSATSKRFAEGLARAFERLNETRLSAREQMAEAKTARAQAVQGRALESAYRKAALAVDKLAPGADQKAAADLLSEKLVLAGRAYGELADAARDHRTDRYAAERYAVGVREDRVRAAAAPFGGAAKAAP